jgi:hypothetical protein
LGDGKSLADWSQANAKGIKEGHTDLVEEFMNILLESKSRYF